MRVRSNPVDEYTLQAGILRAADIRRIKIADVEGLGRITPGAAERKLEDFRVGFFYTHVMRIQNKPEVSCQAGASKLLFNQAERI